ncbi:hypothetical protein JW823_02280 [bacterium]|nr:hypothetical protein [candidate division CSSED10-310 bacterium]
MTKPVEIILDTLGSERGIEEAVAAGYRFSKQSGVRICLVGNNIHISNLLRTRFTDPVSIRIVDARESVSMAENAEAALDEKADASIRIAMREVSADSAVITPGHTGAAVLAAKECLGLVSGVRRACLCQILPSRMDSKQVIFADAGASLNATPADICRFAILARIAAMKLLDVSNPSIGLLNIGAEPGKGDPVLRETHAIMEKHLPGFRGNIEGDDIWNASVDIVITNGITGNILLKSAEGLASMIFNGISQLFSGTDIDRLQTFAARFRSCTYGGAVLLGVNGTCIVTHGRASSEDMIAASELAVRCLNSELREAILNNRDLLMIPDVP